MLIPERPDNPTRSPKEYLLCTTRLSMSAERSRSGHSSPPPSKPSQTVRQDGICRLCAQPRTDISALEHSIKEVYGTKNRAVVSRKHPKHHGVELVDIERNPDRNHYTTNFGAKVVSGRVKADYGSPTSTSSPRRTSSKGQADKVPHWANAGEGVGEAGRHDGPETQRRRLLRARAPVGTWPGWPRASSSARRATSSAPSGPRWMRAPPGP